MSTRMRTTRLPMPLRLGDEPWARPAGDAPLRPAPVPPRSSIEAWPEEPPVGFVDRLVAAACELDPNARAEILPADHETPMARRLRERLASSASHPAPRTQEEPAHVQP